MLNYHEMTMTQSANDPAKRQQFVVITTVMISVLAYCLMTSGSLMSIEPTNGVFPGGNFCYKHTNRDYAASFGLARTIRKEILESEGKNWKEEESEDVKEFEAITYQLYLDDPMLMGGRRQRWATGILTGDKGMARCKAMLATNKDRPPFLPNDRYDLSAKEYFEKLTYNHVDFPAVDSLVLQFPHTHGFVSALTLSYKVIPAMRKHAKAQGVADPVVLTTCNKEQEMCTHYVPLVKTEIFLLGLPTSAEHNAALGKEHFLDWEGFKEGGRRVLPFFKDFIDMLP